jgi:drug/metabolite transporter (DMT)-like permease
MTSARWLPVFLTVISAVLWGSSFSLVKVGLGYLDPYSFVTIRFGLAAGLLTAITLARGQLRLLASYLGDRYVFLLGMTIAASYAFQFVGQTQTTAAKAVIIVNSSAVLVAPMSYFLLKERLGPRQLASLAVGILGVYLITRGRGGTPEEAGTLRGDLIVSGSAVAYGLYVVLTRMAVLRRTYSEIPMMAAVFLWSLPVFLATSVPSFARGVSVAPAAWAVIGYLAVFCSVVPFVLWTAAMKRMGALTSAIVLLSELVFGVFFAWVLLGEVVSGTVLAGCAAICAAIVIVGIRP